MNEKIDFLVDKLGCSIVEAQELIEFDKNVDKIMKDEKKAEKKVPKVRKVGITDKELEMMMEDLQELKEPFQNKDLKPFLSKWNLTARQTPSRLKKLVTLLLLEDLGGSPKSYKVKS